jgi:hypothetical protein
MGTYRLWMLGLCTLLAAGPALGADPAPAAAAGDAQALAARIDQHLAARLAAARVKPAPLADDAEFLRRVTLEVIGRIPSVAEARAFLDEKAPGKRRRLVDRLLESPGYVNHFVNVWRALMLPEANASFQTRFLVPGFEAWLRKQLSQNAGYDQMVRELLTTPIGNQAAQPINLYGNQGGEPNPIAFYLAKEVRPENLAASTARLFLGVRLECAQCHDHPFATWKREQFWGYAAFFAGLQRQEQGELAIPTREILDRRELAIPGSEKVVQASFLDGSEPQWRFKVGPRVTLADWVTSADNPFFARAAVNRLWAHFFGVGLTEPVDDMLGDESVTSHPELLDELAREFAAQRFDVKFLIRAITASRAYQLTSAPTHKDQEDPRLFARMALKSLTPEQLFDSLVQATGYTDQRDPRRAFILNDMSPRSQFLDKFANRNDKPTEPQTSIIQALALMNGKFMSDVTSVDRSETLAAIADAPFLDTAGRIEALYLATLSRKPRPEESARLVAYVDAGGVKADFTEAVTELVQGLVKGQAPAQKAKDSDRALADVFWALLNSSEFILNH